MKKSTHSPLFKIVMVFLAAVVIYAIVMVVSGYNVYSKFQVVQEQVKTLEKSADDGDFETAIASTHEISTKLQEVNAEMSGMHWNLARMLPVIGVDVRCAQGLALIGDQLVNEALIPVLTDTETIVNAASSLVSSASESQDAEDFVQNLVGLLSSDGSSGQSIENTIAAFSDLGESLSQAREVVKRCRMSAEALPEPHIDKLKEIRTTISDAVIEADDLLSQAEGLLSALGLGGQSAQSN